LVEVDFETALADALYVNWAVPAGSLPPPPQPLALDRTRSPDGDTDWAFVTVVLFRQAGLHAVGWPWPRFSFPQCNLRLPVRDGDGVASVWLLRELVPPWVVPLARGFGRQPATAASFAGGDCGAGRCRWSVFAGGPLDLVVRPAAPAVGAPRLGGWPETVAFFRERSRAYVAGRRLRRVRAEQPRADALPVAVEVEHADWLAAQLPEVAREVWARPHSAFVLERVHLEVVVEPEGVFVVGAQPAG
jgi:hypothetical protein